MWNSNLGRWALLIAITAFGVSPAAQSRGDGGTGVTVYSDINFRGQGASFRDDMPNLVRSGWNDKISSIRIPSGEAWEVCQDINYGNPCQVLSGNVADLGRMAWNDRISSLRRIENRGFRDDRFRDRRSRDDFETGAQPGLIFYDRPDYRGTSTLVMGGSSNIGPSARQGSVKLLGGGRWELCDRLGGCTMINQDVADVSQLGLNGHITSARAVNDSRFRRDRDDDGDR